MRVNLYKVFKIFQMKQVYIATGSHATCPVPRKYKVSALHIGVSIAVKT